MSFRSRFLLPIAVMMFFSSCMFAKGELAHRKFFIQGFVGDYYLFLDEEDNIVLGKDKAHRTPVTFISVGGEGQENYQLRLPNNKYLSAKLDDAVFTVDDAPQTFSVMQNNDGTAHISLANGKHLRTNYNIDKIDQSETLKAWETLYLVEADTLDGRAFFLQGYDGKYVSYEPNVYDRDVFPLVDKNPQPFKFSRIYSDGYIIGLKNGNLNVPNSEGFNSTPYHWGPNKFEVASPDGVLFNIRSINNGTYLRANTNHNYLDQSAVAQRWEHFRLIETEVAPSSYFNNWGVFETVNLPFVFNQRNAGGLKLTGADVGVVFYDSWIDFGNDPDLPKRENKQVLDGGGMVFPGNRNGSYNLVSMPELLYERPQDWDGTQSHGTTVSKVLMGRNWKGFRGVAPGIALLPMLDGFFTTVYTSLAHINKVKPHGRQFRIASLSIQFKSFAEIAQPTDVIDGDFIIVTIAGNNDNSANQEITPLAKNVLPKDNPIFDRLIITVGLDPANNKTLTSKKCGKELQDICVAVPSNYFGVTSVTAPIVSGLLALLMEKFPDMPIKTYQDAILLTATPLGNPEETGRGLLNAEAAYQYLEARRAGNQ